MQRVRQDYKEGPSFSQLFMVITLEVWMCVKGILLFEWNIIQLKPFVIPNVFKFFSIGTTRDSNENEL